MNIPPEYIPDENSPNKYKIELEYIERFLVLQGYVVEEGQVFETIVAIITNYKAESLM